MTNLGPNTALNATAVDTLPSDVSFDSASAGCAYDGPNHEVTCAFGDMTASQTESPTIEVTVPASAAGETLVNAVDTSSDTVDPVTSNNHDEASTTVSSSGVLISKTVPDWVDKGASGQYQIDLFSTGPSHAASVWVADPLPSDVVYVGSSVAPSGSCGYSAGSHKVTCSGLGDMGPGATATVTIDVTFPNADVLKCNEATVNWTATPLGTKTVDPPECTLVGYDDTDGDGCPDLIELGSDPSQDGGRDANNPYDFYDITDITGVLGAKDRGVSGFDLNLLLGWIGATAGSSAYDDDANGNTIADGLELDFAGVSGPATGPDGGISGFDLNALLAQVGDSCMIPQ